MGGGGGAERGHNDEHNCWFASDVTAAMLGGQEQKHFSPLGSEPYFDANLAEAFLLY